MKKFLKFLCFVFLAGCGNGEKFLSVTLKPLSPEVLPGSAEILEITIYTESGDKRTFSHPMRDGFFDIKGEWNEEIFFEVEGFSGGSSLFFGRSAPFHPREIDKKIYIPLSLPERMTKVPDLPGIPLISACAGENTIAVITREEVLFLDMLTFRVKSGGSFPENEEVYGCAFISKDIAIGTRGKIYLITEKGTKELPLPMPLEKYVLFSGGDYGVIAGGMENGKRTSKVYLLMDENLSEGKNMLSPRAGHVAIPLREGNFLIAGGGSEPEKWNAEKREFERVISAVSIKEVITGVSSGEKVYLIKEDGEIVELDMVSSSAKSTGAFEGAFHGSGDGEGGVIVNRKGETLLIPSFQTFQLPEVEGESYTFALKGIYGIISRNGFFIFMRKEAKK